MDEDNVLENFGYLEICNCFLEIKNVSFDILKDYNKENSLNTILDIL